MQQRVQTQLDWEAIDTVLLDLDGTLLDLSFDNFFWTRLIPHRFGEVHGLDPAEVRRRLRPRFEAMQGKLEWYCLDYWTRELGLDVAALKAEVSDRVRYLTGIPEFLGRLRAMGKRLVLVTNAHQRSLAVKLEHTDVGDYLDAVFSSHRFGAPKEDLSFWATLQRHEPFSRERTLFADDSLPVLRAAREFGIRGLVQVVRPDSTAPPRDRAEFHAVNSLTDLMPGMGGYPGNRAGRLD